jgi:hypothetical protein
MPNSYFGETWSDYYSSRVGRSRDSDCLKRSNFDCMLSALGGETETVMIVRESHWAVGWVEWIAIHQDDVEALRIADDIQKRLKDYPVINDSHLSELESQEADDVWQKCYNVAERIKYIRNNREQFEFQSLQDMLACVRGEYFARYVSELIY